VLGAFISYKYSAWSNAQIEKVKNEGTREKLTTANEELQHIVWEISQVMVPHLREAAADGKITQQERERLRDRAWTTFEARFTVEWLEDFMQRMGFDRERLKDWVLSKVESFVFEMKLKQVPEERTGIPKPPKVGG